jgi:hypothetical protein
MPVETLGEQILLIQMHDTPSMLSFKIHFQNNEIRNCSAPENARVIDILKAIDPTNSNTVLHSYGIRHPNEPRITEILADNPSTILLFSNPSEKGVTPRDLTYSNDDYQIERVLNELTAQFWEVFNHHTATMFGFVAGTLVRTTKNAKQLPSVADVERRLQAI